ncbi:MAG: hypothetical protein AAGJ38_06630, partial [Planctomycetota bacterium]
MGLLALPGGDLCQIGDERGGDCHLRELRLDTLSFVFVIDLNFTPILEVGMLRNYRSLLIVTLMALLVSPVAMAEDRIALTMNLQPGDSHTMVLDIDQTINQSLMGQQMTMDQLIG